MFPGRATSRVSSGDSYHRTPTHGRNQIKAKFTIIIGILSLATLSVSAEEKEKKEDNSPEKAAREELHELKALIFERVEATSEKPDGPDRKEAKEFLEQVMKHITKIQDSINESAANSAELRHDLGRALAHIEKTKPKREATPARKAAAPQN